MKYAIATARRYGFSHTALCIADSDNEVTNEAQAGV